MTAIIKREISSYFTSPLGYVFLAVFYGFSGLFLWMNCLSSGNSDMAGVFLLMFFVILVIIPVLTMRTFAEERRQSAEMLAELQALRAQLGQNAPEDGAAPVPDSGPAAQPETPQTDTTESAPEPAETR